jgi:hypothetical protein
MVSGGTGAANPGESVDVGDIVGVDPQALPDGVTSTSRAMRMSYGDYDRTLSDLLHLPLSPSVNFPEEQPNLGPYDGLAARAVNERLHVEFVRTAESGAEQVVSTPSAYTQVVRCDPAAVGCRDQFIDGFGLRVFRRPLTPSEQTRYRALFDRAADLVASGDPFRDGVRLVIESMLQSPKFLYRVEQGTGAATEHGVALTPYEVASRLSYMFWGTAPDAALLADVSGVLECSRRLDARGD